MNFVCDNQRYVIHSSFFIVDIQQSASYRPHSHGHRHMVGGGKERGYAERDNTRDYQFSPGFHV
jgi:hypothetical protein